MFISMNNYLYPTGKVKGIRSVGGTERRGNGGKALRIVDCEKGQATALVGYRITEITIINRKL